MALAAITSTAAAGVMSRPSSTRFSRSSPVDVMYRLNDKR
jgi:hypothetical protein